MAPYAFQLRWSEEHVVPDALSRAPVAPPEETKSNSSLSVAAITQMDSAESDADEVEVFLLRMDVGPRMTNTSRQVNAAFADSDDEAESQIEESDEEKESEVSEIIEESPDAEEKKSGDFADARREEELKNELLKIHIVRRAQTVKRSWHKMQEEDEQLQNMNNTYMKEGLLHRKGKIVVPRQLRRIVLHLAHGTAHEGVTSTAKNLKDFYWPKKAEHIKNWCRGCECSKAKMTTRPEGNKIFDSYRALQTLVVDYMVDTIEHSGSRHNGRYILCMVCRATGYCRLAITKSRSAADTALAIKNNWIADFGCPEIIMSDNEGAMTSDLTDYLCRAVFIFGLRLLWCILFKVEIGEIIIV